MTVALAQGAGSKRKPCYCVFTRTRVRTCVGKRSEQCYRVVHCFRCTNILLSFGRLLKIGWQFGEACGDDQALIDQIGLGPCAGVLKTLDGQCRIPVYCRKNSLSILARVHRVAGNESTEDQPGVQICLQELEVHL